MYVIEVIPLRKDTRLGQLSYFSKEPYERGAILTIAVRGKRSQGVVTHCESVSLAKAALRSAGFFLRRLPPQKNARFLPETLRTTVAELAEYYATKPGAVLFALLPKEVREGRVSAPEVEAPAGRAEGSARGGAFSYEILETPREERIREYRRIVRTTLAEGKSIVLTVPARADGEFWYAQFSPDFPERVIFLHSGLGARALRSAYARINENRKLLLTIATPRHAFCMQNNVGTLLIERSRSSAYRSRSRPYLDFRHALAVHAEKNGWRCISADTLLRSEDVARAEASDTSRARRKAARAGAVHNAIETIPMKDKTGGAEPFTLFSPTLLDTLKHTRSRGHRSFLFCARQGLAGIVACLDCGTVLRCPRSGSPLSLHRAQREGSEERRLLCRVCGFRRTADDLCPLCGGWRLREWGIGVERVYNELIRYFGRDGIFLFDRERAKTHQKASALIDKFFNTDGAMLLGTPLALSYLREPIHTSAVVSMDSLLATPSWRVQEEALGTLLSLCEHTEGRVLVQMRGEETDVLHTAADGDLASFHSEELRTRERFNYPPYTVFIHLSWRGTGADTQSADITARFKSFGIELYSAPDAEDILRYGLIRIQSTMWPQDALVDALRSLPPSVRISVNPDRII